jgi:hypothetical protein
MPRGGLVYMHYAGPYFCCGGPGKPTLVGWVLLKPQGFSWSARWGALLKNLHTARGLVLVV